MSDTELNYVQTEAPVSTISLDGSLSSVDEVEQKVMEYLGKNEDGNFVCKLCGKVEKERKRSSGNMKNHIETNLDGISFSCSWCEKQFKSRNSLNHHKSVYHKNK